MDTTNYNFGEKTEEFSAKQGKKIPVWQSDKYEESKKKACEIIESGKYGLTTADFWILMNETKSGKMGYTGLIISHNGCLKINDKLEKPFNPLAVTEDKCGYGGALVFTYCDKDQGLYEVGEVTPRNCKNDYPYAMAFKRMFDRVVLKLSKLAYSGIYSEAESDAFKDPVDDTRNEPSPGTQGPTQQKQQKPAIPPKRKPGYHLPPKTDKVIICDRCGGQVMDYFDGRATVKAARLAVRAKELYGYALCEKCVAEAKEANDAAG